MLNKNREKQRTFIAVDLKSFYASVECCERGLNPLEAKLVVADKERTSKTICLAVSPALKAYGIPGRCRLFEVEAKAKEVKMKTGKELDYIVAVPRMSLYIEYSARIYKIYLRYFCDEDIHVYSVDEVFIDITGYMDLYKMNARELTNMVVSEIFKETGITATAGIGPNLYLCKIAMDMVAKHIPPDANGARIAEMDEISYRRLLWNHKPLTDFWRIGRGISERLSKYCMFTMGDIARQAVVDDSVLYRLLGIDAEILIDHAFGYEPCTMKDIKAYKTETKSLSSGQVLKEGYDNTHARIIVREMADSLALDLFEKKLMADSVSLSIGYDIKGLETAAFKGEVVCDHWGRLVPKSTGGTLNLYEATNSTRLITEAALQIFDRTTDPSLFVRRINICANGILSQELRQPELFSIQTDAYKENCIQNARLSIVHRFGKNALCKGTDLQDGAATLERNTQIGGHRA